MKEFNLPVAQAVQRAVAHYALSCLLLAMNWDSLVQMIEHPARQRC